VKLIRKMLKRKEEKNMAKTKVKRFSKKRFNNFVKKAINDLNYSDEVIIVKKNKNPKNEDDLFVVTSDKVDITLEFRKCIEKILRKIGVDKNESAKILSSDFTIDNVDGLITFFTNIIYDFMDDGNRFDFPSRKGFKGSLFIKNNKKSKKSSKVYSPQTREFLGEYEIEKDSHKTLGIKSTCPNYLKKRRKVSK